MNKTFKYALIYFAMVFAVGFVLGAIRVLYVVPLMGEDQAELLEAPLMVLVCYLSARYLVGLVGEELTVGHMLQIGLLALGLLLAIECTLVLTLRGMSVAEYVAAKQNLAGLAYLISLVLFALFPYLLYRLKYRSVNQD
jgi:predicted membrane-bound spermidine synthase